LPNIEAIACVLPSNKIKNNYLYDAHDEIYVKKSNSLTGVDKRYWSIGETSLSLCINAAEELINDYSQKIKDENFKSKIDFLIVITQTPDNRIPASAYSVHDTLNLNHKCGCLTINAGCTAYVDGVSLAYDLIMRRNLKNVLLLVGDVLSKFLNKSDFGTVSVFGDAGSATLITSRDKNIKYLHNSGVIPNSSKALHLGNKPSDDNKLTMDGFRVFTFAINNIPEIINQSKKLWKSKFNEKPQIDFYALHQANNMILDHVVKKMNLDKNIMPTNIHMFGNTSGVTIPLLLCSDKLNMNISNLILFCGFGVGLSWSIFIQENINLVSKNILYK
jgi:3-oxoacyl-[acyl-carrier-protein] synthase III